MCKHSAFIDDRLRAFVVGDVYRKDSEQGSRGSPRTVLDVETVFSSPDSYDDDDNDEESDELWAQLAPLTIDNGNKSGTKNGSRNRNGKEAPLSIFTAGAPICSPEQRSKLPLLNYCSLCLRSLLPGTDIFMYRGERAFCSEECRYNQILMDEECHESCGASSKKLEPYPAARQARRTLLTFDGI